MHITLVISKSKAKSSHLLMTFRATTLRATMPIVNENDMLTKFVFLDFSLTWMQIIETSLTIPGFP